MELFKQEMELFKQEMELFLSYLSYLSYLFAAYGGSSLLRNQPQSVSFNGIQMLSVL